MADSTLRDFVKEALAKGESREAIAAALRKAGWPDDQINDALAGFADVDFGVPVPRPKRFGGAREAFLYIVYFALLGMIAFQVGALAFAFIDAMFSNSLTADIARYRMDGLRWSIAALVVGYPIFLYLGWRLDAARRTDTERRVSRIRAWLTYVTLIFAALALIGDLVAVVYNFLGGEIEARFIAKAFVVGAISGVILFNYTRDAERTSAQVDWVGRLLAVVTTLVVGALIVWAFMRVDTPNEARARGLDTQRLASLQTLVRGVDCYRSYFDALPEELETMSAALVERAGRVPVARGCEGNAPVDPASGAAYRYERIDGERFRLCAVFDRGWSEDELEADQRAASVSRYYPDGARRNLKKPVGPGEACFDLEAINFLEAAEDENGGDEY